MVYEFALTFHPRHPDLIRPSPNLSYLQRKCTEHHLGTVFQELTARKNEAGDPQEYLNELFSPIIGKCGFVQLDLAKVYAEYEKQVEELVSAPIHSLLDGEFRNILKQKRNLSKYILDKDSASNRYNVSLRGRFWGRV